MPDALPSLSRRQLIAAGAGLAVTGLAGSSPAGAQAAPVMTVYRDAGCGCCLGWVAHARRAGFDARVVNAPDMAAVKRRLGVPAALASCHTAMVAGLIVEGHVPLDRVTRLLRNRPANVRGVAVPGMPVGSPGMESPDGRRDPFNVLVFDGAGRSAVLR